VPAPQFSPGRPGLLDGRTLCAHGQPGAAPRAAGADPSQWPPTRAVSAGARTTQGPGHTNQVRARGSVDSSGRPRARTAGQAKTKKNWRSSSISRSSPDMTTAWQPARDGSGHCGNCRDAHGCRARRSPIVQPSGADHGFGACYRRRHTHISIYLSTRSCPATRDGCPQSVTNRACHGSEERVGLILTTARDLDGENKRVGMDRSACC